MRKKILSAALSLVLVLALIPAAAYAAADEMTAAANALYQLGMFGGTGTDANGNPIFELDREPTRSEAVTMLVRLLGGAEEAQSKEWSTPFTDVEEWAKPYVGYAYAHGLTSGTSETTFGGSEQVVSAQYITFVLRALGYQSGTDFQWDKAYELSDRLGFTNGQYEGGGAWDITVSGNKTIKRGRYFLRGDIASISYNALSIKLKGTDTTLLETVTAGTSNVGEHTHKYVEKTIPAVGHYEQVQVGTEQVLVRNERRQYIECQYCKVHFYDYDEYAAHNDPNYPDFKPGCATCGTYVYTEYVPIYEEKPVYEKQWVESTTATAIRVCEICGQREP